MEPQVIRREKSSSSNKVSKARISFRSFSFFGLELKERLLVESFMDCGATVPFHMLAFWGLWAWGHLSSILCKWPGLSGGDLILPKHILGCSPKDR